MLTWSDGFADGLAGTSLAVDRQAPLLLTPTSELDDRVANEIDRVLGGAGEVILLGGTAAIEDDVATALQSSGYSVTRLAGENCYATAAVAKDGLDSPPRVLLAAGTNFPDALAGGADAGSVSAPIILTRLDRLPDNVEAYLRKRSATVAASRICGGDRAISAATVAEALAAINP